VADKEQPPPVVSDFARERAARDALKALVEEIAVWNEEVARLRAMVTSGHRRPEQQDAARLSLNALTIEITEAEHALNTQLPLEMQSHSRVADVRRAMLALRHAIGELLARLDAPPA
jgi:hypothetical protein